MLNGLAEFFENLSKVLGLTIKIPRPGPAARSVCSVTNGLIGIILIGTGAMLKRPSLTVLGALGIAGAALLSLDK